MDIRRLKLNDMPEVALLEARCFSSSWTKEQFFEACEQRWFAGYGLFAADKLLAYITVSVVAGELEVLNIAVCPEQRGKGLSKPLMLYALQDTLKEKAESEDSPQTPGWERGVLEVRVGNRPALALYEGIGFKKSGLRKHYYSDGEDALVMTLEAEYLQNEERG